MTLFGKMQTLTSGHGFFLKTRDAVHVGHAFRATAPVSPSVPMAARMLGNCSTEPSAAWGLPSDPSLLRRLPGQCVLLMDQTLVLVQWQGLWMDQLYVRLYNHTALFDCTVMQCLGPSCNLFVTAVTLQGRKGRTVSCWTGIAVYGGQAYAEGMVS